MSKPIDATTWPTSLSLTQYIDEAKRACGEFSWSGRPLPETCAEMHAEVVRLRIELAFEKARSTRALDLAEDLAAIAQKAAALAKSGKSSVVVSRALVEEALLTLDALAADFPVVERSAAVSRARILLSEALS